ncbi:FimB/Mfa2 family fimbrial subunit [Bacteroides sp. 519]|uniref:FimB/Mfa2 family fimbrial subunit n=1 Tax=Bacteroides sp. 519 TaxID=2302937 RepID=UPI0013D7A04A|nr:FimB/Mfa2 family fimbrial subunit [Bacteroides sp. 519]NDV60575.1 hypothetical protein [Bacteroides sp. 519]
MMRTVFNPTFLLCFLFPLLLSSCLGEGDLNCDELPAGEQQLTLKFLYNINGDHEDHIREVVDSIDLYIYKNTGDLFLTKRFYSDELYETNFEYTFTLNAGTYTFVAWMNASEEYINEEATTLPNATNRIICNGEQHIETEIQSALYYAYEDRKSDTEHGNKPLTITIDENPPHEKYYLNFAKNTNNIQIDAIFDRQLPTGSEIKATITGKNGIVSFLNRCPGEQPVYTYHHYYSDQSTETRTVHENTYYQTFSSFLQTQRLWENDDLELTIILQEPGRNEEVLISQSLTPLIMQNPKYYNDFMLERFDNYKLQFVFEKDRFDNWYHVEIIVNNWYLVRIEANLDVQP